LYAANAAQATGGTTPADDGVQDAEVVDEQK
jgi:molecular chaperone DnaK